MDLLEILYFLCKIYRFLKPFFDKIKPKIKKWLENQKRNYLNFVFCQKEETSITYRKIAVYLAYVIKGKINFVMNYLFFEKTVINIKCKNYFCMKRHQNTKKYYSFNVIKLVWFY